MIIQSCILIFCGASFVAPTECAVDPNSEIAVISKTLLVNPPKSISKLSTKPPKQRIKKPIDHSRPSASKMNMVTIQPAAFIMGSPRDEARRDSNEGPQREVVIPAAFEIGKYEVTFNDWNTCVTGGGCRGYRPDDGGWGKGRRPVINISWNDTQSYLKWLNKVTGLRYRLPTEAEWEYVARGGMNAPFSTGNSIDSSQANFNGEHPYGEDRKGTYRRKTLSVGSFESNKLGVYDIHGNVYEWVQDCWSPNHVDAPRDSRARQDGDCNYRIMRGGSWVTHGYQMRASKRLRYTKDYRYDDYGFRIARTLAN